MPWRYANELGTVAYVCNGTRGEAGTTGDGGGGCAGGGGFVEWLALFGLLGQHLLRRKRP